MEYLITPAIALFVIILFCHIKVVPQATEYVIERL